ncbi:eukaryotic translation initiation factor 5B-like [Rutidosis leptorrhynchoides]|uniref:eukaryotic translation initiation factor 5B-like n=1 Tax=Rutidosis leptorrhynchoides TaxID=125765 RepID=UPI003A9955E8
MGKKKPAVSGEEDEYSNGTELSEVKLGQEEKVRVGPVAVEKKGKKGNQKNVKVNDDEDDGDVEDVNEVGKRKLISKGEKGENSFDSSTAVEQLQEETVQPPVESAAESAAAKKKKKKKEKKAAMAPAVEEETKGKVVNKKVPKHVKEIQERLARIKEAEEKKKREEEERLKKEEEDRLKQEVLERIAEEKKRVKKEKMLKKKQEGKLLTAKQKAEAQRLELMRKQILEKAKAVVLPQETNNAPTKRPIYVTKKQKPHQQVNCKAPLTKDANLPDMGSDDVADDVEMNGNKEEGESDDEWDTMSWDNADVSLPGVSAFADEEEHTEPEHETKPKPEPLVKNEIKSAIVADNKGKGKMEEEEEGEKTLRSPICCILGHVDTGKTKLLDCIRRTNVQEGEAGGITQQIGATYIPTENIRERTKELKADAKLDVPGLLVIDTPGHEHFKNLRSRGSGLCDIAILVVDIMHGLEPQTIESLNLLKTSKTDFIVALNKVDRLFEWKTCENAPIGKALKLQSDDVKLQFKDRVNKIITQFKEQGVNTELYNKNEDRGETYSMVPTSAISGEGIPEMLLLLVQWAQKTMVEKLTYSSDIQCTVLEVKVIQGLGTTIDVVLVNGLLHEGDDIVVCGLQGPIHTKIRSLLTPHPMKELRVKGDYIHHKEIKAAQVVKITAQNLEHAVAGTALYVVKDNDDVEKIKKSVMVDMQSVMNRIDKSGEGVYVQASSLGSLEALLELLKTPELNIPVSGIGIGPVHKKDVMKASVMLNKKKEFATILAFNVKVTPEAQERADDLGVKIFIDETIYKLFDQFKTYIDEIKEQKKRQAAEHAVFPCVLQITRVIRNKDPIILGVDVIDGILKIGTPICIPQKGDFLDIGRISSIKNNDRPVDYVNKRQQVSIGITGIGHHFKIKDELVSLISRNSIDVLKAFFWDELSNDERELVGKLKRLFKI